MLPWRKTDKIGIIGYGVEGKAVSRYLKAQNFEEIVVYDKNPAIDIPADFKGITGKNYLDKLGLVDVIIRSPGTPIADIEHSIRQNKKSIPITSLTELIFDLVLAEKIAITGSNGKTTTTNLIEHMLRTSNRKVVRFGNDSTPDLDILFSLTKDDLLLLELSSFQLETLRKSPHIAVFTNITPNHLDYHPNMETYTAAKMNIAKYQTPNDFFITSELITEQFEGKKITIPHPATAAFSNDVDSARDDTNEKTLKLNHWNAIVPLHKLAFKTHPANILMALEVARLCKVAKESLIEALTSFTGVIHRLEDVGLIDGVRCYNDSSSTTPDSTITAINQFPAGTFFLLGGSSKNLTFEALGEAVVSSRVKPIVYGTTADEIKEAILNVNNKYPLFECETMEEALDTALEECKNPDSDCEAIVFSPACASFDQFPNAKVRGKLFTEAVQKRQKARVNSEM